MAGHEIVVEGTLREDGTVVLDRTPNLPPGRLTVVLRPARAVGEPIEGLWPFLQRTRRELEAARSPCMNEQELAAHIAWLREGDWVDELLSAGNKEMSRGEQP